MEREGGCACGKARYKLTASPLIVNAWHCRGVVLLGEATDGTSELSCPRCHYPAPHR